MLHKLVGRGSDPERARSRSQARASPLTCCAGLQQQGEYSAGRPGCIAGIGGMEDEEPEREPPNLVAQGSNLVNSNIGIT